MDITTRNRRLKEFALWFEYKFGIKANIKTIGVQRIIDQTLFLRNALGKFKPNCYWCRITIKPSDIDVDTDGVTLHHIDEDRNHNTVNNLDFCHKTCHQKMHKFSQAVSLPTAMLWYNAHGNYIPSGINIEVEIPGLGRG